MFKGPAGFQFVGSEKISMYNGGDDGAPEAVEIAVFASEDGMPFFCVKDADEYGNTTLKAARPEQVTRIREQLFDKFFKLASKTLRAAQTLAG